MTHFTAEIVNNFAVADGYMRLDFRWPETADKPGPGQFFTVRDGESTDPLLRRPFAVSGFEGNTCSMIYQIRGKATRTIAARAKGESIDVLGPLGNIFPLIEDHQPVVIAGGVGFGPIYYFAHVLEDAGKKPVSIFGARTASLLPKVEYRGKVHFCTDDGSRGAKGTVVDMLAQLSIDAATAVIYACGPDAMLAACAAYARERELQCWVSMEQVMGCAVGACMGCVIKVTDDRKYARVCTEGPVFNAEEVVW